MSEVSSIKVGAVTYDIADATVRGKLDNNCIRISQSIAALPTTISNAAITDKMVVVSADFNPIKNVGNINWVTNNGSLSLTGSMYGTVSAVFTLVKSV